MQCWRGLKRKEWDPCLWDMGDENEVVALGQLPGDIGMGQGGNFSDWLRRRDKARPHLCVVAWVQLLMKIMLGGPAS